MWAVSFTLRNAFLNNPALLLDTKVPPRSSCWDVEGTVGFKRRVAAGLASDRSTAAPAGLPKDSSVSLLVLLWGSLCSPPSMET